MLRRAPTEETAPEDPSSDRNSAGRKPAAEPAKASPVIAQYLEIKAANPGSLLFFHMGDFYELFFEDAEIAAKALGIALTKRGRHQGEDIPMCGVPVERAEEYLHRLISQGFRVAVCAQVEDPAEARKRGAKSVVKREVRRLVTPGTLTEDPLLDPARPNRLLALARIADAAGASVFGYAALDISTGEFLVGEAPETLLEAEIARLEPAEIVLPDALAEEPAFRALAEKKSPPLVALGRALDGAGARRRLCDWFGLSTLDGLGALGEAELSAAALALLYVERTQFEARPALALPSKVAPSTHMEIDAATLASLELARAQDGGREGSLLEALDRTVTAAGGRLLGARLASPLLDPAEIAARQESVAFFLDEPKLRATARAAMKAAPDPARAISRLALERGGPRDLAALRDGLAAARTLGEKLKGAGPPAELAAAAAAMAALDPAPVARLSAALAGELPQNRRDGGFVREGYDAELDAARALRDDTRKIVAELQARYCELAQTRQLKLRHNNFLGYFLEAPRALGEKLLQPPFAATFVHRQTMADAMRFSTAELAELDARIAGAADAALAREEAIFAELAALLIGERDAIRAAAGALAVVDVSAALAETAERGGWTRPLVDDSLKLRIEAGRHPVVEAALARAGEPFVANDCELSGEAGKGGRLAIVTGPNMAGKSTYLRQCALIAVLAQIGSYAPARRVEIGVVDRLFSRVGASDDLARGRSTFMVEMVETAAILNCASERSLVILDEIGRGTATFDGLAIAWAALEHLNAVNRSRALFATHFHELTRLAKSLERVDNLAVRVAEWSGEVVFLHEIAPGAADQSYGVQVGRLAGLPASVTARAKLLLAEFETADRMNRADRLVADLPLFQAAPVLLAAEAARPYDVKPDPMPADPPPAPAPDPALLALDALDPDELSPKAALEALYRLKSLRGA